MMKKTDWLRWLFWAGLACRVMNEHRRFGVCKSFRLWFFSVFFIFPSVITRIRFPSSDLYTFFSVLCLFNIIEISLSLAYIDSRDFGGLCYDVMSEKVLVKLLK